MGIAFDHVQYVTEIRMMLGETSSEIIFTCPFTDQEFYRAMIDPGFDGNTSFFEGDLFFRGGAGVIQDVTWRWQVKEKGASTWQNLHTAVTEEWTGGTNTGIRVGLDAAALGANADAVPLEIRLLVSASTAADISVSIGGAFIVPAVRVFGETT